MWILLTDIGDTAAPTVAKVHPPVFLNVIGWISRSLSNFNVQKLQTLASCLLRSVTKIFIGQTKWLDLMTTKEVFHAAVVLVRSAIATDGFFRSQKSVIRLTTGDGLPIDWSQWHESMKPLGEQRLGEKPR